MKILMTVGMLMAVPVWAADSGVDQAYKTARAAVKVLADGSAQKAEAFEKLAQNEGHAQTEKNGSVSEACANVEAWCWQNAGWQWFLVGDFEKAVTNYEKALACASIDAECKRLSEKDMATAKAKLAKETGQDGK